MVLALGLIAVLLLFDWNWLKGPLERWVSAKLGRPVEIAGPLEVDLSLQPRITVQDLRLANPDWASDGPMLAVQRAEIVVDLRALLHGQLELPEVSISKPTLRLETRPDGPPNWKLKEGPSKSPPPMPEIGQLRITDALIRYLDRGSGRSVVASLDQVAGSTDDGAGRGLALAATGKVEDRPLALKLSGPPAANLVNRARPYRLAVDLKLGESDVAGKVTLDLGKGLPAVSATLHSDQVKISELAGLIGAAREPGDQTKGGAGPEAILSSGLKADRLPRLDADLDYSIGQLSGPDLALHDVKLDAGLHDRLPSLTLKGGGQFKGEPVTLDVRAGPAKGATGPQPHYRIDATIEAGQTRFTASGAVDDPEHLQGVNVQFAARSADLAAVLRQAGIDLPKLPALEAAGELTREGKVWRLADLYAQVGESDLSGRLEVDLSRERPLLSADLHSDRLRAADLMPAPADRQAAKGEASRAAAKLPALFTPSAINLDALPEVDADLKFRGDYVQAPEVVFDQLKLDLKVRDRILVVDATGEGTFHELEPVTFEAHAGTEANLKNPQARYPIDITLQAADSKASAKGSTDHPLDFAGLDLEVTLRGPDLQALGKVLKLPLPATPPYDLSGKVSHQPDHQRWNLVAIRGTVGDSDLEGDVSLELAGERPTVVADLKSKRLDFDDLGVLVGAPPDTQPGETASAAQRQEAAAAAAKPYVLPDKPFNLPDLRAIDTRVRFEGEAVQARMLPLQNLKVELTLQDGKLNVAPMRLELAGGELEAVATLDGRGGPAEGDLDLSLKQIKLNQLLSRFNIKLAGVELEKEGVGTFGGRARLRAHGNSVHDLAATADGDLAVIMGGGQINALIIEAIGLDVGEALGLLLTQKDEARATMVPMQCFIGRFDVQQGVLQVEALILETSDSTITGEGEIDLGKETLALRLLAHPKDASVLTASTPVRIEGTFKHPSIELVSEELKEKSLAALALGVVLPVVGAFLPFLEPGEAKGSNCADLLKAARAAMPAAPAETGK